MFFIVMKYQFIYFWTCMLFMILILHTSQRLLYFSWISEVYLRVVCEFSYWQTFHFDFRLYHLVLLLWGWWKLFSFCFIFLMFELLCFFSKLFQNLEVLIMVINLLSDMRCESIFLRTKKIRLSNRITSCLKEYFPSCEIRTINKHDYFVLLNI